MYRCRRLWSVSAMARKQTAFFLFSNHNRAKVRTELEKNAKERQAQTNAEEEEVMSLENRAAQRPMPFCSLTRLWAARYVEQKISVADIGRELGVRWRALSEDEKKLWKTRVDSINQNVEVSLILRCFNP